MITIQKINKIVMGHDASRPQEKLDIKIRRGKVCG